MSPWNVELLLSRAGGSAAHARALCRDAERGLLVRIRPGVYAERDSWEALGPEGRHVVAMRALDAVAPRPPVFSHWSAAVLHGLPVLSEHLARVHVTVPTAAGRGIVGVAPHVDPSAAASAVLIGTLRATNAVRTVVDAARSSSFSAGVVTADGALRAGLPREALQEEVRSTIGIRGRARARAVIAFARAEAGSAAESLSRECMMRLGIDPPVLQFEVRDRWGLAGRLDFWFPQVRAGGEVDGLKKYLDPVMAAAGAGRAVIAEKHREDRVRRVIDRLARWGWPAATSTALLAPILSSAGVRPGEPRAVLADYCTSFLSERL